MPPAAAKVSKSNKAGIVLVCAMWEAYCEDVCREGVYRLLRNAQKTNEPRKQLPKELLKLVVAAIGRDKNELAMWGLAGKSWFSTTCVAADESLVDRFHTPNADEVDGLFEKALGLKEMSRHWHWSHMTASSGRTKLDKFVKLRHKIAHRSQATEAVHKTQVTSFLRHATHLVRCTDGALAAHLTDLGVVPGW